MSLESRKLELVESILRLNSIEVINSVQAFIDDKNAEVVAYTVNGQPLDKETYKADIQAAKQGGTLSHE